MEAIEPDTLRMLHGWYVEGYERSRLAADPVRRSLGYSGSRLAPRKLEIAEFEQWLLGAWRSPELKRTWLRTVVSGHEEDLADCPDGVRDILLSAKLSPEEIRKAS